MRSVLIQLTGVDHRWMATVLGGVDDVDVDADADDTCVVIWT